MATTEIPEKEELSQEELLSQEDWDSLIDSIKQKNCVLILGPNAAIDPTDNSKPVLPVQFAQHLLNALPETFRPPSVDPATLQLDDLALVAQYYISAYNLAKNMPVLNVNAKIQGILNSAQKFYTPFEDVTTDLHLDLAAIPIRFFLCVTPDRMLVNALRKQEKNPIEAWYGLNSRCTISDATKKASYTLDFDSFDDRAPLVFNLLGRACDKGSLFLTSEDMMDFAINLGRTETALDDELIGELRSNKNIVFLFFGFGFGSSHSRFLVKLLTGRRNLFSTLDTRPYFHFENVGYPPDRVAMFLPNRQDCIFHTPLAKFARELRTRLNPAGKIPQNSPPAAQVSKKPRVFLCHCARDKDRIEWMPKDLEEAGIECWIDTKGLDDGVNWETTIKRAIREETDYFLIVISASMLTSVDGYFYKEMKIAFDRRERINENQKYIFPLLLDCPPKLNIKTILEKVHPDLGEFQATNLSQDQSRFRDLINEIHEDWRQRTEWGIN